MLVVCYAPVLREVVVVKLIRITGNDIRRMRLGPPKISAEKLAKAIGVTRKTIVNWENDMGSPTVVQFLKICLFCRISAGKYLLAAEERKDENQIINLESVRQDD